MWVKCAVWLEPCWLRVVRVLRGVSVEWLCQIKPLFQKWRFFAFFEHLLKMAKGEITPVWVTRLWLKGLV